MQLLGNNMERWYECKGFNGKLHSQDRFVKWATWSPVFSELTSLLEVMLTSERQSTANEKNTLSIYLSFVQIYLFFQADYRTHLCFWWGTLSRNVPAISCGGETVKKEITSGRQTDYMFSSSTKFLWMLKGSSEQDWCKCFRDWTEKKNETLLDEIISL